jgi:hypothetical protein
MAGFDTGNPDFIDGLDYFHVHGIFAGGVTGTAHVAIVNYFHQFIRIVQPFLQKSRSHDHAAASAVGMVIKPSDTGTNIDILEFGDFFEGYKFTGRAPSAGFHIVAIFF